MSNEEKPAVLRVESSILENEFDNRGYSRYYDQIRTYPENNRLSIPRMRKGAVTDLAISPDRYAHNAHASDIFYHGLHEFIRTGFGERNVPVTVFDNHQHAFYMWCEAIRNGSIRPGCTVVHFDDHPDSNSHHGKLPDIHNPSAVYFFVRNSLPNNEFVTAGFDSGILNNYVWINDWLDKDTVREVQLNRFKYKFYGIGNPLLKKMLDEFTDPSGLIVDIDIDFFSRLTKADVDGTADKSAAFRQGYEGQAGEG